MYAVYIEKTSIKIIFATGYYPAIKKWHSMREVENIKSTDY